MATNAKAGAGMLSGVCVQGRGDMEHEENMETWWMPEHAGRMMVNGHECTVVWSFDPVMADLSYERSGVVFSSVASPQEHSGRVRYAPGLV